MSSEEPANVDHCRSDGVLKPKMPLPLAERAEVRVTIESQATWAERTAGLLRWSGAQEELERLALDPHFDPQESA